MLGLERFVACGGCGCHARVAEINCPFCGTRLRNADGSFARAASAAVLGLSAAFVAAIPGVACSDVGTEGDGSGGAGGRDATGQGAGWPAGPSSSTNGYSVAASYGPPPTMSTGSSGARGGAGGETGSGEAGSGGAGGALDCDPPEPDDCAPCCDASNVDASTAYAGTVAATCGCAVDGPCLGACMVGLCTGEDDDADCAACLAGLPTTEYCVVDATEACAADPACAPLLTCYDGCSR